MRTMKSANRRPGATMVEMAFVLPILVLFIVGIIVLGLGAFRYQQIATMAREGARYASVRGAQYQAETGNAAATPADVYANGILPLAVGLDPSSLSYSVTWPQGNAPEYADPADLTPPGRPIAATVVVTVNYDWLPAPSFPFFGPAWNSVTLTSTSIVPMHY